MNFAWKLSTLKFGGLKEYIVSTLENVGQCFQSYIVAILSCTMTNIECNVLTSFCYKKLSR